MEAYKEKGEIETVYRCEECCEEFDTRALAANCCAKWICNWCGEDFETKKEANACCKDQA